MSRPYCVTGKLYRLYTENVNDDATIKLFDDAFPDGYSLFTGTGRWNGIGENCLILEVLDEPGSGWGVIEQLAKAVKTQNHQQSVLVTVQDCEVNSL